MLSKPCCASDIFEINKQKEYTLISSYLLENVLTDTKLNAQTTKLWQILFNQARYNQNLEIKISYYSLAKKLNRSTRTISRYIDTLVSEGYLVIKHNFDIDGGQRPNTIYVRVPDSLIDKAKKMVDRKIKSENTEKVLLNSYKDAVIDVIENKNEINNSNIVTNYIEINNNFDSNNLTEKSTLALINSTQPVIQNDIGIIKNHVIDTTSTKKTMKQESCDTAITHDNTVKEGHDINVIQIESNKKDIKNNNNVVVDISYENVKTESIEPGLFSKETIVQELSNQELPTKIIENVLHETFLDTTNTQCDKKDEEALKEIEIKVNELYIKMASVNAHEKITIYEEIRKLWEIASAKTVAMNKRQHTAKLLSQSNGVVNSILKINPSVDFSQISTDRTLSQKDIKRIEVGVDTFIKNKSDLKRICNEIIYAVRFGSLRVSKNGELLSVSHATSIALKLLREKRWETPAPLQTKTALSFADQNHDAYTQKKSQRGYRGITQTMGMA